MLQQQLKLCSKTKITIAKKDFLAKLKTISIQKQHSLSFTTFYNGKCHCSRQHEIVGKTKNKYNIAHVSKKRKFVFSKNYFLQWRMPLQQTAAKVT